MNRKPYGSDVTDEEWAFVAPYLTLMSEAAPQCEPSLREVFNGLRWIARTGAQWRWLPHDLPPWQTVYQPTQRWLRGGCFEAMVHDLRRLLRELEGRNPAPGAAVVSPADEQEREHVSALAEAAQEATGDSVELADVDQGYTGENAADQGIRLAVVRLPDAKHGLVRLPRRWVVERSFAWMARFRRLARDYEHLPETLRAIYFVAFSCTKGHSASRLGPRTGLPPGREAPYPGSAQWLTARWDTPLSTGSRPLTGLLIDGHQGLSAWCSFR